MLVTKWNLFKFALGLSLFSALGGAAGARHFLNQAHANELARQDRACLKSVFLAASKKPLRKPVAPKPKLVSEGTLTTVGAAKSQ